MRRGGSLRRSPGPPAVAVMRSQSSFDPPVANAAEAARMVSLLRAQNEQLQLEAGALKAGLEDERNKVKAAKKRSAQEAKAAREEEAARAAAEKKELKRK